MIKGDAIPMRPSVLDIYRKILETLLWKILFEKFSGGAPVMPHLSLDPSMALALYFSARGMAISYTFDGIQTLFQPVALLGGSGFRYILHSHKCPLC